MGGRKPTAHQHVVPDSKATCQTEMVTATTATGNGHKARPNATSTYTDTEASTVSQLLVSKLKLSVFHSLSRDEVHWNVLPSTRKKTWSILFAVQLLQLYSSDAGCSFDFISRLINRFLCLPFFSQELYQQ